VQFAPTAQKFKNDIEVTIAFASGKLPWVRGDNAMALTVTPDAEGRPIITEHQVVRVLDVCGISASHEPIYMCETESKDLMQVESQVLWSWQRLMFDARGGPSDYARWVLTQIRNRQEREANGFRTEVILLGEVLR